LGFLLRAYEFPEPARSCFAQAERLDPRDSRWPYFLSHAWKVEAPARAIAHLRRAVQLCGNDLETRRLRLATVLAEDGQWNEAEQELQALLRDKRDFTPALLLSARRAQASGDGRAAIAPFREAIRLNPERIDPYCSWPRRFARCAAFQAAAPP
jgi:tetratricopeptide (TPR) repeat protein